MMERLLRKNSTARILSVILAIVLWFYVVSEQNPTLSKTFQVPVEVISLDPGMAVVSIDPATVSVAVQGLGQVINGLTAEDFAATINLADAAPGPVVASVRVTIPNAVQLIEVSPAQVISLVETVEERAFPVELAVTGRVAPDYRAGEPRLTPTEVVVRGGASPVARVERVVTNLDVGGAHGTVQQTLSLYAIDASGRQVTGVRVMPSHVTVTLPVRALPPLGALPVEVSLRGEPADGFRTVGSPRTRPEYVVVRAPSTVLARLSHLSTAPVDMEGARQPIERSVPLVVPDEVELVGPETVVVYVPIHAEPPADRELPDDAG